MVSSASAGPSTSSSNPSKDKMDWKCQKCASLVQSILQNPDSRPRQVLQSLISGLGSSSLEEQPSLQIKPVQDGVKVILRIPDLPYTIPKLWRQVAPADHMDNDNDNNLTPQPTTALLSRPVLATSAAAATTTPRRMITETIQIECRPCDTVGPEQGARALIMGPNPLSIVACTNRLTPGDKEEMSQVLVHELLHAYDVKRLQLDFTDCESMAYSEVRAAREAECHSDPGRSWQQPSFLKEYCVKQKAIAATHNLFPSQGRQCVRQVFEAAYQDPRPFDKDSLKEYVERHSAYGKDSGATSLAQRKSNR